MSYPNPDLTLHPPRSARVRLGGYVILPRMLDKGRALLAGKNGDYKFNCPLDQRFTDFAGIDAEALKEQLAAGKGDGEILEWIKANAANRPSDSAVVAWSAHQEQRAPGDVETRNYFNQLHTEAAAHRKDISTWFDLLDLDDYTSYGGKA
jgi:hypothetical protein